MLYDIVVLLAILVVAIPFFAFFIAYSPAAGTFALIAMVVGVMLYFIVTHQQNKNK